MVDTITADAKDVEQRLRRTCQSLSGSWIHLLMFNSAQLQVVMINFSSHMTGELMDRPYTWYFLLADIFHGVVGTLLLIVFITANVGVTSRIGAFVDKIDNHTLMRGIRAGRRAELNSHLQCLRGFDIEDVVITKEFAVQFCLANFLVLWSGFTEAFILS